VPTPVWFARDVLRNAPTITVFYIYSEADAGKVNIPWVILGGGSLSPGSISALRGTGDAASGLLAEKRHHRRCREPGNFAAQVLVGRRPGSWIAEWMDRRVVRELSLLLVTLPPPNFAPPLIAFQQHP
jgi:hypothetical protein